MSTLLRSIYLLIVCPPRHFLGDESGGGCKFCRVPRQKTSAESDTDSENHFRETENFSYLRWVALKNVQLSDGVSRVCDRLCRIRTLTILRSFRCSSASHAVIIISKELLHYNTLQHELGFFASLWGSPSK